MLNLISICLPGVEKKLCDPRSLEWERFTCVWSIFGIVGVLRACIKVAVGLSSAEAAGVELVGAGGLTSERTSNSSSCWVVGSETNAHKWQDNSRRTIGYTEFTSEFRRPHIIATGYSLCHSGTWNAVIKRLAWMLVTISMCALPSLILRGSLAHSAGFLADFTPITLVLVGGIVGTLLPLWLFPVEPVGVNHLGKNTDKRYTLENLVREGDTVITSSQSSRSVILWQGQRGVSSMKRPADSVAVRCLAALSATILLAAYFCNYVLLGHAQSSSAYLWLLIQVAILIFRFGLWAARPIFRVERSPTVVFLVTGAITTTLSSTFPTSPSPLKLPHLVVRFAIASAGSKIQNNNEIVTKIHYPALIRLAGKAPADILSAPYFNFSRVNSDIANFKVVRLPWSFIEELYAAQGLILPRASNPWSLGGLCLGAVFERDDFAGLTTMHPSRSTCATITATASGIDGPRCPLSHDIGITREGFISTCVVAGDIVGTAVAVEVDLLKYHDDYRNKIARVRELAVSNGGNHVEVHAVRLESHDDRVWHRTRTRASVNEFFKCARVAAAKDRAKDHSQCPPTHCPIHTF